MTPDGTPMDELPPPEPKAPQRGRWTVEGCDWSRWPLVQPEALLARLVELQAPGRPHDGKVDPFALVVAR